MEANNLQELVESKFPSYAGLPIHRGNHYNLYLSRNMQTSINNFTSSQELQRRFLLDIAFIFIFFLKAFIDQRYLAKFS